MCHYGDHISALNVFIGKKEAWELQRDYMTVGGCG